MRSSKNIEKNAKNDISFIHERRNAIIIKKPNDIYLNINNLDKSMNDNLNKNYHSKIYTKAKQFNENYTGASYSCVQHHYFILPSLSFIFKFAFNLSFNF